MKNIEINKVYQVGSSDIYLLVTEDWCTIDKLVENGILKERGNSPYYDYVFYSMYDNELNVVASNITVESGLKEITKKIKVHPATFDQEAKLRLLIDVYNQNQY